MPLDAHLKTLAACAADVKQLEDARALAKHYEDKAIRASLPAATKHLNQGSCRNLGFFCPEANCHSKSQPQIPSRSTDVYTHMGVCQNYGPLLGPLNIRCRIIIGSTKGP